MYGGKACVKVAYGPTTMVAEHSKSLQFSRWSDLENLPPFNMIFWWRRKLLFTSQ